MPLLVGLDGVRVMGQSLGNYVGIDDEPREMFEKLMSLKGDEHIVEYLRLCTALPAVEILEVDTGLAQEHMNPAQAKRLMAREVISLYHGSPAAIEAELHFDKVHRDRQLPEAIPEVPLPQEAIVSGVVWLPRLLTLVGLATSNGDARRLILQGAIRIQGEQVREPTKELRPEELVGKVLQVGRRRFVRLT